MNAKRIVVPVTIMLVTLVLTCGALGNWGKIHSNIEEINAQAAGLAIYMPGETDIVVAAAPTATEEATVEATESAKQDEKTSGPLDFSLETLKDLTSYRSTMEVKWSGTKDDKPVEGYLSVKHAFVREPPAYEMHVEGSGYLGGGADEKPMKVSFYQIGDQTWFYTSENDSWMQVPSGQMDFQKSFLEFSPASILPGFNTSQELERNPVVQEVNGVQCYQYTFTEKDIMPEKADEERAVARAQGEASVAVDGGYIVKLTLDASIDASTEDEMFQKGTLNLTYELSDINQPITIELPPEATEKAKGREDIPMLPDAKMEFSTPDMVSYNTASSVKDAIAFYETEMPKQGWMASGDETFKMEDMANLAFIKGTDKATVLIMKEDTGGTNVMISVQSQEGQDESTSGSGE
jgi:hypothetical protein